MPEVIEAPITPAPPSSDPALSATPVVPVDASQSSPQSSGPSSLLSAVSVLGKVQEVDANKKPDKDKKPAVDPAAGVEVDDPKRHNFKVVVGERDAALKEVERIKAEQTQLATERDALKKETAEAGQRLREAEQLKAELEKARQEAQQTKELLRAASIERDPDFVARYDGGVTSRKEQLKALAISNGATPEDFEAAFRTGNEDTLATIRESLTPGQVVQWDTHRQDIVRLQFERGEAVKHSDQTWQQLEDSRADQSRKQQERLRHENLTLATRTVDSVWDEIPGLKDSQPEVRAAIENTLKSAVADWPREKIMRELAIGQVRAQVIGAQAAVNEQLKTDVAAKDAKIAELQAKIDEQDQFIKGQASDVPRGGLHSSNGNGNGTQQNGSLLSQVRVTLPGR